MSEWVIHVRPVNDDVPPDVRICNALKTLLRAHRLKCTDVRELSAEIEHEQKRDVDIVVY